MTETRCRHFRRRRTRMNREEREKLRALYAEWRGGSYAAACALSESLPALLSALDEAEARAEKAEAELREADIELRKVADELLGLQPVDRDPLHLLIDISRECNAQRIRAGNAESKRDAAIARAEKAEAKAAEVEAHARKIADGFQQWEARNAGVTFDAVREALNEYEAGDATFGRLVDIMRAAAKNMARDGGA